MTLPASPLVARGLGAAAVAVAIAAPWLLSGYDLNLLARFLALSLTAMGLVLLWGEGGVLSLGQGVFFGLGGYAMAMFLKLEASDPESTKIQSTPGIPDFMDWNQLTALPSFWLPFKSLPLTLILVIAVPTLLAFIIVIVGGLGSMPGALLGGVLIGITEALAGLLFTPSAKSMFAFAILVLVLLFRPEGIVGRRTA